MLTGRSNPVESPKLGDLSISILSGVSTEIFDESGECRGRGNDGERSSLLRSLLRTYKGEPREILQLYPSLNDPYG
ncbi:MAG: hypothetical protein ACLFVS_03645 [Candidatus Acetothermia bacterium]